MDLYWGWARWSHFKGHDRMFKWRRAWNQTSAQIGIGKNNLRALSEIMWDSEPWEEILALEKSYKNLYTWKMENLDVTCDKNQTTKVIHVDVISRI